MSSRGLFFSGDDLDRQEESMVGLAKVNALCAFTLEQWTNRSMEQWHNGAKVLHSGLMV
jgi:hypothetical protein